MQVKNHDDLDHIFIGILTDVWTCNIDALVILIYIMSMLEKSSVAKLSFLRLYFTKKAKKI